MAEDFVDIAGRVISATEGLADEIRKGMQSAVSNVKEFSERDSARNSTLEDIKELMGQLNQLSGDVGEIKTIVQQSIQMHTSRQKGKTSSEKLTDIPTPQEKLQQQQAEKVGNIGSDVDKPLTEKAQDTAGVNMWGQDFVDWLKNPSVAVTSLPQSKADAQAGDEQGYKGLKVEKAAGRAAEREKKERGLIRGQTGQKQIMRSIAQVTTGLLGILTAVTGGISASNIFKGAIKEELDYHRIMSQIALQAHGLSNTSAAIRDNFRSAGDRLATVSQTGQEIGKWMKGMVSLQQRGLKNQKFNDTLMKSALNMATMTGIEAEVAGEQYADWAQHFHMGNFELATMNLAMKDIVRQTGLTGKNLETAMKTAEGLQRKMKAAGTATADMLESSIRISAIAQKKGIADVAGTYTEALSAGFDKFSELPNNIKGALMRFGQGDSQLMEDIMAGRGMQEENLRKIAEGMKVDTKEILGLDLMSADLTKIDSTRMKVLQIKAQKIYGMAVGDLQKMVKTMDEGSRTIAERSKQATKKAAKDVADLDKQRAAGLITEEQHTKMIGHRNAQLATQLKDLKMTEVGKELNAVLGTAAKEGGAAFNEALIKAGDGNMNAGIAQVQQGFLDSAVDAQAKMKAALDAGTMTQNAFDAATAGFDPKKMSAELKTAMEGGDTTRVADLQQKLVDMQQAADAQGIKGTNVVDQIENNVNQINAYLRNVLSDKLIGILEAIGATSVIIGMVGASIVTAIAGLSVVLTTIFGADKMGAMMGKLPFFGKGGSMSRLTHPKGKGFFGKGIKASFADAGMHFKNAAADFGKATAGMRKAVGKYSAATFKWIAGTKVFKGLSRYLDNFGKSVFKFGANTKKWIAGNAVLQKVALKARGGLTAAKTAGMAGLSRIDLIGKGIAGKVAKARSVGVGRTLTRAGIRVGGKAGGRAVAGGVRLAAGLGRAAAGGVRGITAASQALPGLGQALLVAMAAAEGLAGALQAGAKANEIFNVSQEEVTMRMRMAAEGAGFFTGMLNGLSFGLFEKYLGPTGSITIGLAKFMKTFWPLAMAIQVMLLPLKILWGILKGLWLFLKNSFIGLWEGIKIATEPVVEILDILWDAISEIGGVFGELLGAFGIFVDVSDGMPSIVDMISGALGFLGTALGWVFKAIGFLIKVGLTPLVWAVKYLVKPLVWLIKKAFEPLIWAAKIVGKTFVWLYDAMVQPVVDAVKGIYNWFHDLYMWLVGGSLIPDLIMGIFKWFLKLPKLIFKAIWKIPSMIIDALLSIPEKLVGWASSIFESLGLTKLSNKIWDGIKALPGLIWNSLINGLSDLGDWVWKNTVGKLEEAKEKAKEKVIEKAPKVAAGSSIGGIIGGLPGAIIGGLWGLFSNSTPEAEEGFAVGTQKITKGGIARLHVGETVVPANAAAEGNGSFKSGGGLGGMFKNLGIGGDESNRMKEFYFDLASSLKNIDANVETITKIMLNKEASKLEVMAAKIVNGGGTSSGLTSGFFEKTLDGGKEPSLIEKAFGISGADIDSAINGIASSLNPFNWFSGMGTGEVTPLDTSSGNARTMSAEESAEARLTRHKVEGQPQQVMVHGTDTESLRQVGLDQINILNQIRDGIDKLNSAFDIGSERVGVSGGVGVGDPTTRYTGNAAALDFGASPYSTGNEPGMQQVVSQGGVGE